MDESRIKKLQAQLNTPCLVEQTADLLYLTGMELSKGRLFVSRAQSVLFVDGRYYERAKKEAPCSVLLWDEQKKLEEREIAFDSAAISYNDYLTLKKDLSRIELKPWPNPLKQIRAIKETQEIEALKKAAHLTWLGIQHVAQHLKEGVSEEELALEFEVFCLRKGASGLSFESIIAFGENSAYPHYRAGKARLEKGQVILVDVGAVVDRYHGDMTRIFYFGAPDPRILKFEQIVKQAQNKAIQHIRPGVKLGKLDEVVIGEFDRATAQIQTVLKSCSSVKQQYRTPKTEAVFEDPGFSVKQLYTHSLGHGVGLETHEFPRIRYNGEDRDVLLQPGMVITIEPGLYLPGVGGVRIEDMVLVTQTGCEKLFAEG